jgi:hypothetical protein
MSADLSASQKNRPVSQRVCSSVTKQSFGHSGVLLTGQSNGWCFSQSTGWSVSQIVGRSAKQTGWSVGHSGSHRSDSQSVGRPDDVSWMSYTTCPSHATSGYCGVWAFLSRYSVQSKLHKHLQQNQSHAYFSPGLKRTKREGDNSPPSRIEVKNAWSFISTPSCLHNVMLRHSDDSNISTFAGL